MRDEGEYPTLRLGNEAWAVLKGEKEVRLIEVARSKSHRQRQQRVSVALEGAEQELFEVLRALRRAIAQERSVPAFVIFSDATLVDMAMVRPGELEGMLDIKGIGRVKHDSLGLAFFEAIDAFCKEHKMSRSDERSAQIA